MYHGTERNRGQKMVTNQKMFPSISDDKRQHWLGDGIYLYRELFYAFRWILLMYDDYYDDKNKEAELLKRYSILHVEVECNSDRIFRLENPEHYIAFKRVEEQYRRKSAFSSRLNRLECTDGIILNIMFKNMNYGENYDAVEAVFPTCDLKEELVQKSKFKSITEYQMCVKNDSIIRNIKDISDMVEFNLMYLRFNDFEGFKKRNKRNTKVNGKYSNSQRGEKYGKR